MLHFVYILECADTTLYVGSTNNLEKRVGQHNFSKSGAHYTKIRRPVVLKYSETFSNLHDARKREAEIKRFTRERKLELIRGFEKKMERGSKTKQDSTFSDLVVLAALSVPFGRVTTYGRISKAAGGGIMASQSITTILGKASKRGEKSIPFHRIVYADGRVWLSSEYCAERMKLYKKEGIEIDKKGRIKNFRGILFEVA